MTHAPADGLVVVDKPAGRTSHDVVARVRRLAGTRKVGHAGTLDPMATGILLVGVNRATRLLGHLMLTEKEYVATIRLGVRTDSDDADGAVLERTAADRVSEHDLTAAMAGFTGAIAQIPSTISAVKIDGRRAYDRARSGEDVVLAPRDVTVHAFDLLATRPGTDAGLPVLDADVRVVCSSGTYVRALARDVGAALGVGGSLTALRRTRVGPYALDVAQPLEVLEERFTMLPLSAAVAAAFPQRALTAEQARLVISGVRVAPGGLPAPYGMFDPDGNVVALAEDRRDEARTLVVFAGQA